MTRLSRHIVVVPIPAAPLLTDTRRSAVGSGTREDIVTMPDELWVHDAFHVRDIQRARHVRGDPDEDQAWRPDTEVFHRARVRFCALSADMLA